MFYLPGVCIHIDIKGKQRKTRIRNILKFLEKTHYLINTLYLGFQLRRTKVGYRDLLAENETTPLAEIILEDEQVCYRGEIQ